MAKWYDTLLKVDPEGGWGLSNLNTTAKVLGTGLGAYGIASALGKADSINKFLGVGGSDQRPVGYQKGIPTYTASREVLKEPQGDPATTDMVERAGLPTLVRRPGSGGRRYFTDMKYTPTGDILGGRSASTGTYMPEDQIAALLAALTESQASGTGGITTPTTTTPVTATPATTTATKTATTTPTTTTKATTTTPTTTTTATPTVTSADIQNWFKNNPGASDAVIAATMNQYKVTPAQLAAAMNVDPAMVEARYKAQGYAQGGLASLARSDNYASGGYYLGGSTDGMADKLRATIDGTQEARLSDGEFVIPADVVSHFGNGNSDAGAKVLYNMMDRVRKARTGTTQQGRKINPNKYTPA